MRSVNGEHSSQCSFAFQVAGAVVALLFIASCGNSGGSADSIAMDRDVEIAGISGNAMSLAAMPDGGFVIAGYWQAAATDANGAVQWRYPDPGADTTPKENNPSEFHGVVPLSNGNILLCGIERTSEGSVGMLTILNSAGQLVDKRFLQPSGPDKYFATRFDRCFRWGGGVAVIGGTAVGVTALGWLVKLNGDGVKQWELFDHRLLGIDAIEIVDHSLVMANTDLATSSTRLVQVNPQGQIIATKDFTGYPDNMARSAAPASTLKVLTNLNRKNTEVFTLNEKFEQIAPSRPTEIPVATDGCAWVLWDGSVAVFGHVFAQPGTDRSSVARIAMGERSDEMRAFALPTPQSTSDRVYDAVPISEKTFVAVRGLNASVALSWVTFK
jgi:hypothetical protein